MSSDDNSLKELVLLALDSNIYETAVKVAGKLSDIYPQSISPDEVFRYLRILFQEGKVKQNFEGNYNAYERGFRKKRTLF